MVGVGVSVGVVEESMSERPPQVTSGGEMVFRLGIDGRGTMQGVSG